MIGGKNNCYQHIVNQIPPHNLFIEAFGGSAAITRNMKPSQSTIIIEANPATFHKLRAGIDSPDYNGHNIQLIRANCLQRIEANAMLYGPETFIYLDPPYLHSVRKRKDYYGEFEMSEQQHKDMINMLRALHCHVMISGYPSKLYDRLLSGWRTVTFTAQTRNGPATEKLWMNYPEPKELHDYSYYGSDFTDRQRIKRKAQRWVKRFKELPPQERNTILETMRAEQIIPAA